MIGRLVYLGLLFLGALLAPWWLVVLGAMVAVVAFKNFYELVLPALWADAIWLGPEVTRLRFPLALTLAAVMAVYLAEEIKELIRLRRP